MSNLMNLADIARSAGLKVVEVKGWRTRGHAGGMSTVETVACHHTAGPAKGNMPSLKVVTNGRAGLPGPLSHYGLGRNGTVYVIAAGLCWHAGDVRDPSYSNAHAIGIEAEATGTGPWPQKQLDAYARLCAALCREFDLDVDRVLGHKEICAPVGRKPDPNFDMNEFRSRVSSHLQEDPMESLIKDLTAVCVKYGVTRVYGGRVLLFAAWRVAKGPRKTRLRAARVPLVGMDDPQPAKK